MPDHYDPEIVPKADLKMSAPEDPASLPGSPLTAYIRALRAHPVVIIAVIVVAVGAAAAFTRTRTYDATTGSS